MARYYAKSRRNYSKKGRGSVNSPARSRQIAKRRGTVVRRGTTRTGKSYNRRGKYLRKRTKVHVPRDGVKETFFQNKMNRKQAALAKKIKAADNIYTSSPVGTQITATSGQQGYREYSLFSPAAMRTALSTIGQAPANVAGNATDTNRIFWRWGRMETMITNNTNGVVAVDILHCITRRDTSLSMLNAWILGMEDAQSNTTDNSKVYGAQPTYSPTFNTYWKIKERTDYTLAPGGTIRHNWVENVYKAISNEVLATDANPNAYLGGLTQVMLIIAKGMPGTDSLVSTAVNTVPVKLDVVTIPSYHFTWMSDNDNTLKYDSGTGMAPVGGTVNIYNQNGTVTDTDAAAVI